jgi:Peptidase family M1 domain
MIARAVSFLSIIATATAFPASLHSQSRALTGQMDVLSNEVSITPDYEKRIIIAKQTTMLTMGKAGPPEIIFSPNGLTIQNAFINGQSATFSSTPAGVVFSSPTPVQADQKLELVASFYTAPNRGFSFNDAGIVGTYFACDWMLCRQDSPSDKSTLWLALILPAGMSSVSMGQLDKFLTPDKEAEVHSWRSTTPFSSYLFGFAAGRFETVVQRHKGRELAYINATGQAQPMEQLFGTTPAMVDFFASKAGIPLPARRYSQILVTGSNAQEHATYSVIGTAAINPILIDPTEDWVIAHELAHQWWGNSVTAGAWEHLWLNEGITVFMTAAWKEHRHGRAAYDREIGLARTRWTRARDAGWDRPLAFAGDYPSLGTRRAIQYSKGALFLDHLRTTLGETVFWRGLREYTRANAGKAVVSQDFQAAMESASGRDLRVPFDQWVYGIVD